MPAVPKLSASPGAASLQLTPSQMDDLIAMKLGEVCAGISDWKLPVTVRGTLGDLPQTRYSGGKLYRLPLVDTEAPASVTYLDIKEAQLEQAQAGPGDRVRATGTIAPNLFKGAVSFRLDVVALELDAPSAAPKIREAPNALAALRRLALDRHPFPDRPAPTITLIHSAASDARVADDFLGALGTGQAGAAVRRVPVSMHDPAAVTAAIREVTGDIVALVRGGGDAASFAVFEDARLLEALAACRAYRVLGLGHTANRTLADLVADHAASTPTAAGEHVRRGIEKAGRARSTNGRLQELHQALAERDMELERVRQAVRMDRPAPQPAEVWSEPREMAERGSQAPRWFRLVYTKKAIGDADVCRLVDQLIDLDEVVHGDRTARFADRNAMWRPESHRMSITYA